MCKVNGHSIFSYGWDANPFKDWKRFNSKNDAKTAMANAQIAQYEKQTRELQKPVSTEVEGTMPVPVVPVKTVGTGINNNTTPKMGLNL